ncbi:iron ABC transporter [Desulfonema ishimotonii]|uniref:Iron ABC transporter n=1 Tax=Desulfonema ishimotonii TaxID=45657 RepID=A0A401FW96_9BACT|nr:iron chelate uptake ABC transporter family permease subunit [Desulfonema ishimotonii]GBC61238.1 iron ABC transporter [Desulfonema ishimotonii]
MKTTARSPKSVSVPLLTAIAAILWMCLPLPAQGASLSEHSPILPRWADLVRVLTFQDYNTRVVILGTTLLGFAAGLVGTFLLLRKRALLSDTISHTTLPGIALAFILISWSGGEGKNLLGLMAGAAVFSVLGTGSVMLIQRYSRLKDDAALGIVLSVYFGLGIALMGVATRMETGNAAGLNSFIYGKTASMLFLDALIISLVALASALFCIAFFKEFSLVCFDRHYAATQGWPVGRLDFFMMFLVVVVTVIGLQAVGLILVVALLIIPPAAARFWTHRLRTMVILSGLFGALSGMTGAAVSALMVNLPAGAVIVLMASALFIFSLTLGTDRGMIRQVVAHRRLSARIARENLLRTLYELDESEFGMNRDKTGFRSPETLLACRSWSPRQLRKTLNTVCRAGWAEGADGRYRLTRTGLGMAAGVVRNHRLWEAFLIAHADVAPGQVDWGADKIEHVLDQEMIASLEKMLPDLRKIPMPETPHTISPETGGA